MITVDNLLIELYNKDITKLSKDMPSRDKKILISLARQMSAGNFLTENQGKMLVKILNENRHHLTVLTEGHLLALDDPMWSKPFRIIEQIRKIFISKDRDLGIIVEFTYNKRLKQQISDLVKSIEGQLVSLTSKQYLVPLTEKNIYTLVSKFKNQGFVIEEQIMNFYQEILKILENPENKFDIFTLSNEKIISSINKEVGKISEENLALLHDRSIRYQYTVPTKIHEKNLKNSIASRTAPKVWINSKKYSLDDLIETICELDRFPLLVVFNGHDSKEGRENLKNLSLSLKKNNINDRIGVYYRFDNNTEMNKNFNSDISALGYNSNLDSTTLIAGIANNKLPKFLLKTDWYPKTVISFSNNFRNNKTSVYCDAVDLIVYYNEKQPLEGSVNAIM